MKQISLLLVMFWIAACGPVLTPEFDATPSKLEQPTAEIPMQPSPPDNPTNPKLIRGNAYLDSAELLTLESSPLQFALILKGNLPTPCNQLQVDVNPPDAENKITVDVYSLVNPDVMCAQVLQPFEENMPLGNFPAGHYALWVNGNQVAEFDA